MQSAIKLIASEKRSITLPGKNQRLECNVQEWKRAGAQIRKILYRERIITMPESSNAPAFIFKSGLHPALLSLFCLHLNNACEGFSIGRMQEINSSREPA